MTTSSPPEEPLPFESEEALRQELVALLDSAPDMFAMPAPRWEERARRVLEHLGPVWDRTFDQERPCADPECGHPYRRHFDGYEDMAPVGCKYCLCGRFVLALPGG